MIRMPLIAILAAGLFAAGAVCTTSESAAEPLAPGSLGPSSETPPVQMQELTDAMERFKQGDFEGALKFLQEAVKKDPDLPPPNVLLADWFAQHNVPLGMRRALERAVIKSPDDPQAYIILGNLAIRERRIAEAGLLFEKAESLMAKWKDGGKRKESLLPQLYSGLAATAEARGDWAGARKQLDVWLKLDPTSAAALVRFAQCLFRENDVQGALEKLKAAAKTDTGMLPPEAALAQWFARSGDQEKAKKWLVAALTAAPKDPQVRLVAAQWAWETDQLKEAAKQADAALQLDPNYYQAKKLHGLIAFFQKDYKRAELYFESAHIQNPKDPAASNNLALALAAQKDEGKRQLALEYAVKNVEQYPNWPDAYSTCGWVLYKFGRLEEAEKMLRKAVSGGTYSAETAYFLACVLADRGREADAARLLQSALKSTAPFAEREEAKALLEQLQKAQPPQAQPKK